MQIIAYVHVWQGTLCFTRTHSQEFSQPGRFASLQQEDEEEERGFQDTSSEKEPEEQRPVTNKEKESAEVN